MSSLLEQALAKVGVTSDVNGAIGASLGLTRALDTWNEQNLGIPNSAAGRAVMDVIENSIPPIFRTNPSPPGIPFKPKSGEWTAVHYADDLVAHHPKFKFIFKVKFEGFEGMGNSDFYYYVHRCDKPNITLNHMDVNYYNFRTRVLTSTTFQPIAITFLDEIGNSVNDFFVKYLSSVSGQGSGSHGIENGFGKSTSSKPYKNGYSSGKAIIINQIFANGLYTNEYRFVNPRIENFQFDELNMEDNAGSLLTIQFSYDSLIANTYSVGPGGGAPGLYSWGNTDILKGGGTSGAPNAGETSMNSGSGPAASSANGGSLIAGLGLQKYSDAAAKAIDNGVSQLKSLPGALQGVLVEPVVAKFKAMSESFDSGATVVDRNIKETIKSINDGANFNTSTIAAKSSAIPLFNSLFG